MIVQGNARISAIPSGPGVAALYADAQGMLYRSTSDASLKTNISPLTGSLNSVMVLNGVEFNWTSDPSGSKRIGFIAQEVEEVLPGLVFTNPVDGLKGVNYAEMTAVLVEAVKEQQQIIEDQKIQLEKQQQRMTDLETLVRNMQGILGLLAGDK